MATVKDVNVKIRLNVLSVQLNDKGDSENRPPHEKQSQRVHTVDIPAIEIPATELAIRLEKAQMVLEHGYWVDPDDVPPQVITNEVTSLTSTSAILNGHVKSCSDAIHADCGFEVETVAGSKVLAASTVAVESPVMDEDMLPIHYHRNGLTPGTRYYYRAFATDINFSGGKYGILKSFKTPLV